MLAGQTRSASLPLDPHAREQLEIADAKLKNALVEIAELKAEVKRGSEHSEIVLEMKTRFQTELAIANEKVEAIEEVHGKTNDTDVLLQALAKEKFEREKWMRECVQLSARSSIAANHGVELTAGQQLLLEEIEKREMQVGSQTLLKVVLEYYK